MATLTGRKTIAVDVALGVKVLDGFLQAFNVPSGGVASAFQGADTATFSFGNVRRLYIDPPSLGQVLKSHKLDPTNSVNRWFLTGEHELHVIESVITTNEFTMSVESSQSANFKIDIPLIENLLAQAHAVVTAQSTSSKTVFFTGKQRLAFAFTCSRFYLDDKANIWSVDPSEREIWLGAEAAAQQSSRRLIPSPSRVLLRDEPGLFFFDEDDE